MATAAPGWYPDPGNNAFVRWWDGEQWTAATRPVYSPTPAPNPFAAISTPTAGTHQSFPPTPNQSTTFIWDGKDAYGRTLQGLGIEPEPIEAIVPSYLWRFRKTGQFRSRIA